MEIRAGVAICRSGVTRTIRVEGYVADSQIQWITAAEPLTAEELSQAFEALVDAAYAERDEWARAEDARMDHADSERKFGGAR